MKIHQKLELWVIDLLRVGCALRNRCALKSRNPNVFKLRWYAIDVLGEEAPMEINLNGMLPRVDWAKFARGNLLAVIMC